MFGVCTTFFFFGIFPVCEDLVPLMICRCVFRFFSLSFQYSCPWSYSSSRFRSTSATRDADFLASSFTCSNSDIISNIYRRTSREIIFSRVSSIQLLTRQHSMSTARLIASLTFTSASTSAFTICTTTKLLWLHLQD